jgi:UDP-N-acetylmuramyl pentapeptide phosphotransferase/UDP-N-acetylglucosamine-1-phosphate transferase
MLDGMLFVGLFGLTTFVSWVAVGHLRNAAVRHGLLDVPNERSSHVDPVPLGGGLSIVALNLTLWLILALTHFHEVSSMHAFALIAAGLLIAVVSLIDDMGHVPFPVRLGAQTVAALIFVVGVYPFGHVTFPEVGTLSLGVLAGIATVIWLVGMTNSFNFMDGIDGMAGGLAVSAGVGWIILGWVTGHEDLGLLGGVLGASALGFLFHNWHPARIFMGDVGATFLGFAFGALTVVAAHKNPTLALAGALLVWPSFFDSGFTVARRLLHRGNIFVGHRTFLFHRLVLAGWSHSQASSLYFGLPLLGSVLAVTWAQSDHLVHEFVLMAALLMAVGLWAVVRNAEQKVSRASIAADVLAGLLETPTVEPVLSKRESEFAS